MANVENDNSHRSSSSNNNIIHLFSRSNDGKEHIEGNLDAVEEEQSVLVGDKLEVDGMNDRPDLPRSLAGSKKIILEFVSNSGK